MNSLRKNSDILYHGNLKTYLKTFHAQNIINKNIHFCFSIYRKIRRSYKKNNVNCLYKHHDFSNPSVLQLNRTHWNDLAAEVRQAEDLATFKRLLSNQIYL